MDIFFGNLFWGILIVLIGTSIILKSFGVKLPLVSTFIAVIIIIFGIKILLGAYKKPSSSGGIKVKSVNENSLEYSTVFSSSQIDLSNLKKSIQNIEVTAVFGSAVVILPDSIEFDIESNAVFGSVIAPTKTDAGISSSNLNVGNGIQKVRIEADAVFGRLEFIIKPSAKNEVNIDSLDTDPKGDF